MRLLTARSIAIALFTWGVVLLPPPGAAWEGPIQRWLKERKAQQEQQETNPEGDAQTRKKITKAGDYSFKIQHHGRTRMYRIHVPTGYDPAKPVPLLFALHGGGGNMDYQADDARYGLIGKSERAVFIVVFPNGFSRLKTGKFATWNAGKCCAAARDNNIDDVGFIRRIVATITRQMNIDRGRIYAAGMSNGGMMSYRLACEMSDVFKAIASVAGTDNTRSCNPKHPISILHIHARNDDVVQFTGGAGPNAPNKSLVTDFTSVPATVSKWVRLNGCPTTPQRTLDKPGVYCEKYSPCRGNTQVQLCVTETGGHSWPGAQETRNEPASQAISADDVMWDFFNRR